MLQFLKKSSCYVKHCVNGTKRYYGIIERVLSVREKIEEACLKGIKYLNKKLLTALPNELKMLWSCFY